MVRDVMGRVGYVPASSLMAERPPTTPGVVFAGCVHSPIEATIEPCRERAQVQYTSCHDVCEADDDPSSCFERCNVQLQECLAGCDHGPCLLINEKLHKCVKPEDVVKILADAENDRIPFERSGLFDPPDELRNKAGTVEAVQDAPPADVPSDAEETTGKD